MCLKHQPQSVLCESVEHQPQRVRVGRQRRWVVRVKDLHQNEGQRQRQHHPRSPEHPPLTFPILRSGGLRLMLHAFNVWRTASNATLWTLTPNIPTIISRSMCRMTCRIPSIGRVWKLGQGWRDVGNRFATLAGKPHAMAPMWRWFQFGFFGPDFNIFFKP